MKWNYKPFWQAIVLRFLAAMTLAAKVVPLRFMLLLGGALGRIAFALDRRYRKVALNNLDIAYGSTLASAEKLSIIRGVFVNFAKSAVEFPAASTLTPDSVRKLVYLDPSDRNRIIDLLDRGKGLIAFSAHFGNFELMARRLAMEGFQFTVVVRNDGNAQLATAINELRRKSGYDVIGRGTPRALLKRVRNATNEVIAMLPDQKSDDLFVPFFGRLCGTVAGPAVLAMLNGSPIVPLFCVRMRNQTHRIIVGEAIEPERTDDKEGDRIRLMDRITREIEEMVRRYPEQWLWLHDRWRVKPSEEDEARWQAKRAITA